MLTEDQSSCLVLDLDPTLGKSGEHQGYLRATAGGGHLSPGTNPMDPVAVGKSLIGRNPFKYQSYEMTPPSSPQLSPVSDAESGNDDRESASTNCSQQLGVNYSKANIMKTAKLLFEAAEPGNTLIYRRMFLTDRAVYQRLQEVFPALDQHHSHLQISAWLTAERAHFGEVKTRRHGKRRERGRWLWVYKAAVAENLQETDGRFRSHCSKTTGNWVNVGYVRKSKTLESDQSRVRHLQTMMATLVNLCMCTKLFASPCSSSTASLLGWDFKRSELLTRLDDCDGDTQAPSCPPAQPGSDCASSTTQGSKDPDDVQDFLQSHNNIEKVAVNHAGSIEPLDSFSLLYADKNMKKFLSRVVNEVNIQQVLEH